MSSRGDGRLEFRALVDQPWLSITPSKGSLESGESVELRLAPDAALTATLASGTYLAEVTLENLSGGFGTMRLEAQLVVQAPAPTPRPGPSNTGPRPGIELVPSGSIVAEKDGQVIEGVDVYGQIIKANDVLVRNFKL